MGLQSVIILSYPPNTNLTTKDGIAILNDMQFIQDEIVGGTGILASGAIVGATSVPQVFTNGVTSNGRLIANAGIRIKTRVATVTPVVVAAIDSVVIVKLAAPAAVAASLPAAPTAGDTYTITDGTGDAGANNITVTPAAGLINGLPTFILNSNYQSTTFLFNGVGWSTI